MHRGGFGTLSAALSPTKGEPCEFQSTCWTRTTVSSARPRRFLRARGGSRRSPSWSEEREFPQDKLDKAQGSWTDTPYSLDGQSGRRRTEFVDFLPDDAALSPYDALENQKWSAEVQRLLHDAHADRSSSFAGDSVWTMRTS